MTENEDESLNELLNGLLDEIKLKIENEHINKKFLNLIQTSSSCSLSSSSSSSENENSDGEQSKQKFKPKPRAKPTKVKSSSDEDDDDEDDGEDNHKRNQQVKYLKTKNEITIDDLPPIEKLNLVLESSVNLIKIGRVISIVDNKLVVIQTLNNCQEANKNEAHPLDEDTILFDENRKGLGKIFETFGPVVSPFYSLRFNLNEIKESQLKVDVGSFIYYAPESTKYTKFIFNVDELRQLKGSDASWNNDNEPPVECIEYSDDEQERQAKRELKMRRAGKSKIVNLNSDSENDEEEENEDNDDEEEEGEEVQMKNNKKPATAFNNIRTSNMNMKKSQSFSTRGGGRGAQHRTNNNFNKELPKNNNNNFIPKSNSYQSFSNSSNQHHMQPSPRPFQGYNHQPQYMNPPPTHLPPPPQPMPYYPHHPIANNGYFMPHPPYPYYHQHQYQSNFMPAPPYGNGMLPTPPPPPPPPASAQNSQFYSQEPMMYSNTNPQRNSFNRVNNNNNNNNKAVKNPNNISNCMNEGKQQPKNPNTIIENNFAKSKNIIKKSF